MQQKLRELMRKAGGGRLYEGFGTRRRWEECDADLRALKNLISDLSNICHVSVDFPEYRGHERLTEVYKAD